MSLWRTADERDWVLIPISAHEMACVERTREAMQRALRAVWEATARQLRRGRVRLRPDGRLDLACTTGRPDTLYPAAFLMRLYI
jgi:hypothetical protein